MLVPVDPGVLRSLRDPGDGAATGCAVHGGKANVVTGVVSVRSVAFGGPIGAKLPQPGWPANVVNSGQLASRNARSPPQS